MEDAAKDQTSVPACAARSSSKLRYPLRSATKSKEEKPPVAELANSSASKRARPTSSISKSVGVLDLSAKEKSAKPPRRLSIPAKSTGGSAPKLAGNITPISETRAKRSINSQGKSDTPLSDVSKSSSRRKFSALSSASYWLSQIKHSETAAKHSISLGFFKLALEARCEPLQLLRDELKSYASRHNLTELGEAAKEIFESYNILESLEQLQISETCSQVLEEGTQSSDDEVRSSSSITGFGKLDPKSLNADAVQASPVNGSAKKDITQKKNTGTRTTGSLIKTAAATKPVSETAGRRVQRRSQKPNKQGSNKERDKITKQGRKSICEKGPKSSPSTEEKALQEDKENMDAPQNEVINLTTV